ncbi:MAG TPA: hydrogenase expression/formation protein HypE [Planctomycetota bacterium]|nr:hydrogenase expression/formation protein HypE [Planctomycetota bacterium]
MSPFAASCPLPITTSDTIRLGHGSGGKLSADLMERVFLPRLAGDVLRQLEDSATVAPSGGGGPISITTDAFVVSPRFFPGGDLGSLAVHGTVNDLAMSGSRARWLATSFILEEGLPVAELERLVESMGRAARDAGVEIVAGDTKVVNRGAGDGCYITTTGVGEPFRRGLRPSVAAARPGDRVIVAGPIGLHGIAILSCREGLTFEADLESDSAALHHLVGELIEAVGPALHTLRDPTRGGIASALDEIAHASGVGILLEEDRVPVPPAVHAACEMLGLDPFYVANEGKLVAIVAPEAAEAALAALRAHPLGSEAAPIGEVTEGDRGFVLARTRTGGRRVVQKLPGEQLPRIC